MFAASPADVAVAEFLINYTCNFLHMGRLTQNWGSFSWFYKLQPVRDVFRKNKCHHPDYNTIIQPNDTYVAPNVKENFIILPDGTINVII